MGVSPVSPEGTQGTEGTKATRDRFTVCLKFTLAEEGGYSDDPHDHGGATNLGIIQREYDAWRRAHGQPERSVRLIQEPEAAEIYTANYWTPMHCAELEAPLDLVCFDAAVNLGIGEATRILQRHVGATVDGSFGPATLAATQRAEAAGLAHLVSAELADRAEVYRQIARRPGQYVFLSDWLRRVADLRKAAALSPHP